MEVSRVLPFSIAVIDAPAPVNHARFIISQNMTASNLGTAPPGNLLPSSLNPQTLRCVAPNELATDTLNLPNERDLLP